MYRSHLQDLFALEEELSGEILHDVVSRSLYATDASPYEKLPLAVVRPRSRDDCIQLVQFAAERKIALVPRGGGTSLAGQCVGDGIVVDMSRHLNQILSIDRRLVCAVVQPGVVPADLNAKLRAARLMFAPDPSTMAQCNIGGMLGNNAWGAHAPSYGTTRDHVIAAEAVLSDGSVVRFGALDDVALEAKLRLETVEGHIYRTLYRIVDVHRQIILNRYPSVRGVPNNAGYALDVLALSRPWNPDGHLFNLAPFLCGSEGTLALITEITTRLVPLPAQRLLVCVHFADLQQALHAVESAMHTQPSAVELLDRNILELTRRNLSQSRNRFWVDGDPQAVLLIEYTGETEIGLQAPARELIGRLRNQALGYAYPVVSEPELERVWALRRAGLGLLMGISGSRKAVTGIEDTAVPLQDLSDYCSKVLSLTQRLGVGCVIYGSVSMGLLHLRPLLDLRDQGEREAFQALLEEVALLAARYRGSISAKHGDGRLRSQRLEKIFGSEVVSLLMETKHAFDPDGIFNPQKILGSPPVMQDFRGGSKQLPRVEHTYFDWSRDVDILGAAERCQGAASCRKSAGRGTMCPSYMALREELHTTRGRANLLRYALSSEHPIAAFAGEDVYQALGLCLACKACRSECPANVDMARLKAESLQHRHDRLGVPLRTRIVAHYADLSHIAALAPAFANRVLETHMIKRLLGVHERRELPRLAVARFSRWFARHKPGPKAGQRGSAVLCNDPYVEYFEPAVGRAAVRVLEHLGFSVVLPPGLAAFRARISQGLLRDAADALKKALVRLVPLAREGLPIIGLEPSELLTFRDEAADLLQDTKMREYAGMVAKRALLFEEFLTQQADHGLSHAVPSKGFPRRVLVHVHCHQKAMVGTGPTERVLRVLPSAKVEVIASPCCGMAGAFGYERDHYALSMQIGELVLFPAVRAAQPNAAVVATGTSCRQQIAHATGVRAWHPAEIIAQALNLGSSVS